MAARKSGCARFCVANANVYLEEIRTHGNCVVNAHHFCHECYPLFARFLRHVMGCYITDQYHSLVEDLGGDRSTWEWVFNACKIPSPLLKEYNATML